MHRDQFKDYLKAAFPKHTHKEDHEQFDFALIPSEKRDSSSYGAGVPTENSINNTESIPVLSNKNRVKTSSALNANNTPLIPKSLHRINKPIHNLRKTRGKQNTSNNTLSEASYNVLVVCSDENKNTDYDRFKKFISQKFYSPEKKINTTFLNARKNSKWYPQYVKDTQYDNHFDMIWFAGCILLCDIFNRKDLGEDDPLLSTVERTYDILKEDGIVIFTKYYENRSIDSSKYNPTMKVQKMPYSRGDQKNKDISRIFLGYFTEIEEANTGIVFYEKKHPLRSPGPSSGKSFSSVFVDPETMTTSSMSTSSSIRNSKPVEKFSVFLKRQGGIPDHIEAELEQIFSDPNWTVYNPSGDGFCTIHAIYKDHLGQDPDKEFLVNQLYEAMKKYIDTTDEEILIRPDVKFHTIGGHSFQDQKAQETKKRLLNYVKHSSLPYSIVQYYIQERKDKNQTRIDIQELYDILKESFQKKTGPFQKKTGPFQETRTIRIEDAKNVMLTKQSFQEPNIQKTKKTLRDLENSNDLGTENVKYFPYITGRNILYITVDKRSETPIQMKYYEGKRDSSKTPQNTILFNCSGHTVLLQNTEAIKNALVKPYVPKFSAQQVNRLVKLGFSSDNINDMTRDEFNEIMRKGN